MQIGGASLYVPEWMITVMALTFGGGASDPARCSDCLARHNPRIISLASRKDEPGCSLSYPPEAKVTCRFLVQFSRISGAVCDTKMVGPLGTTQIYVSRGNARSLLPWRFTLPAEITRLELLPRYFRKFPSTTPRTGAAQPLCWNAPAWSGHVPRRKLIPQKHARR